MLERMLGYFMLDCPGYSSITEHHFEFGRMGNVRYSAFDVPVKCYFT